MERQRSRRAIALLGILAILGAWSLGGCHRPGPDGPLGTVTGVVIDDEAYLSSDVPPQTYAGARIEVVEAVPAGVVKQSANAPEQTTYMPGDMVARLTSGEDGRWQVHLPPGTYFIRAFYGERSYSGDIMVTVEAGTEQRVELKLKHGL